MEGSIPPEERIVEIPLKAVLHRCGIKILLGVFCEVVLVNPTLHARTALVCLNKSYWHIEHLAHKFCKEISRCREFTYCQRRTDAPRCIGIIKRLTTHLAWYLCRAHAVGCIEYFKIVVDNRTLTEALQWHFHITLSGTHPHLTGEDIAHCHWFTIIECHGKGSERSLRRLYADNPFSLFVGLNLVSISRP